jgi:hypothetical protein
VRVLVLSGASCEKDKTGRANKMMIGQCILNRLKVKLIIHL